MPAKSKPCRFFSSADEMRDFSRSLQMDRQSHGFVPTMGNLHAGHLELVRQAQKTCDCVTVSIFVNPRQFGPNEDFASYPRSWEDDRAKLESLGTDVIYSPEAGEMYPPGFSSHIEIKGLGDRLEGEFRPGFFKGVATVVGKLFMQVEPDKAFFGEKDFQQLLVVRKMVRDLNMGVEIVGVPCQRDENGLALSSRNAYLSEDEKRIAPELYRTLCREAEAVAEGASITDVQKRAVRRLEQAGFGKIDYVAVCDAESLEPAKETSTSRLLRILAAAWLGRARLIDNVAIHQ